ncbi:MAG: IS3 family transposase [Undibacterium sp.]|nr:IS3 family transposase [Opitutaceae bacterium]
MNHEHPIKAMCEVLAVSRSGYYQWQSAGTSARALQTEAIRAKITRVHAASRGTYGSPRVTVVLHEQGESVGRNRVARLMKEAGLQGRQARRYRVRTTDSDHHDPIAPNLLAEVPAPTQPDAVWVTDITYVETGEGWLYLAGVLDLYSRRLIGWAMGSSLETALPLAALHMALRRRRPGAGLLHHSDRGCQYASAAYRSILAEHGCIASMSRRGNCYDNATMESFWSTLKLELIYRRRFATRSDATTAIFDYIESFYNRTRLHSALGYQSPLDYESNLN